MLVSEFVPRVFLVATGKVNTFTTGSTKWLKILALANNEIDQWQDEPNIDWSSLRSNDYTIGTVTATNVFPIPTPVRKISGQETDIVRVLHVDGVTYTDYDIITSSRVKDYANGMRTYQNNYVSQNGQNLYFNRAFTATDPQFGGTILAPVYLFASHISADTDVIPVDIPNYLVYATAAAYDSTDVTRQNLVPRLEAKANQILVTMKSDNAGQLTKTLSPWNPMGWASSSEAFN